MRISLLLLALAAGSAEAQRRPPVAYVELGGEGLGLSANLDVGVTQSVRLRGGAGFAWVVGILPFSASYLVTRRNSTFEVGGGATVLLFLEDTDKNDHSLTHTIEKALFLEGQGTKVLPVGILGWRYHPPDGALIRVTLTPVFYRGRVRGLGGVSFGFTL
jgi:hypothetical protein